MDEGAGSNNDFRYYNYRKVPYMGGSDDFKYKKYPIYSNIHLIQIQYSLDTWNISHSEDHPVGTAMEADVFEMFWN